MGPETGIIEIGDIIRGVKPGRVSPDEITICDLTGVGVQDTAIAILAYQRARENHLGSIIS
jgi:ornithine cyclodeaminase